MESIKINVYLDSNIWLDLYHYSANDIEEFSKLKDIINTNIILYMPNQTIHEINRNRDNKIADAYKKFHDFKMEIPNFCKGYSEYSSLMSLYRNLYQVHKELVKKVTEDIAIRNLPADKIIKDISLLANRSPESQGVISKAELRYKRGNPPGKNKSLGDAITWETLLEIVPNNEDLFFVSGDKDYKNQFGDGFNSYLNNEWEITKNSKIYFYTSLTNFFNEHQKEIHLQTENEKEALINSLMYSGSFRNTHDIIRSLNKYEYYTDKQMNELIDIAVWNDQVRCIFNDYDIISFYRNMIKGREDKIILDNNNIDIIERIKQSLR